jgi:hypothetical protein
MDGVNSNRVRWIFVRVREEAGSGWVRRLMVCGDGARRMLFLALGFEYNEEKALLAGLAAVRKGRQVLVNGFQDRFCH